MTFADQLRNSRVLPVIVPQEVDTTVTLCRALQAGGMTAMEITLRTPAALDSMRAVKEQLPSLQVAAGTVTSARDLQQAMAAGADFCVSPGISAELLLAAREQDVQLLPGVATASEVMLGLNHGCTLFKLFPAVASGGIGLLKSLGGPFPQVRFCPTGGLTAENFQDFLALPNVICCGGSWMVSEALVSSGNWDKIEEMAREAMQHNSK